MIAAPEDEIVKYITRFASPPADQVRDFAAAARTSLIAKGGFLVELGDTVHPLYFVHSGAVRYMLIVPETGEDVTKDFSFAPTFAASFGSAVSGQPARVAIAATMDCVVSSWPLQRLTALYDADPQWQKLGRKLAEWLYVRKEDREIAFLTQTAEQRYAALTQTFPGMIDQVPQRHLASYLGITPESLSRLKARLAKRG
jgi:CRP/FNR family transcriptional regulator, anaerobic regulatory protein